MGGDHVRSCFIQARIRRVLTSELVKLEGEGDGEEEELVGNSDDGGDAQVVVVEDMGGSHCGEGSDEATAVQTRKYSPYLRPFIFSR